MLKCEKRYFKLAVGIVLLFCLAAVLLPVWDWITVDLHGDLRWTEVGKEPALLYEGGVYYPVSGWLDVKHHEEHVELGWHYNFPFTGQCFYYADSLQSPSFIYNVVGENPFTIYLREDDDFSDNIFLVEDSEFQVTFLESFAPAGYDVNIQDESDRFLFTLYLKDFPEVFLQKEAFCIDGVWYVSYASEDWIVSDKLVQILLEAGRIKG